MKGGCLLFQQAIIMTISNIKSEKVILEIESVLISNTFWSPFAGRSVKKSHLEDYLTELKQTIKEDFNDLNNIHALKEQIILDAQQEADSIRQAARDEVEKQDIAVSANEYAKQILSRAKEEAEAILNEASQLRNDLIINTHKYCDNLLESVETEVGKFHSTLNDSRSELRLMLDNKIGKLQNDPTPSI